MADRVYRWAVPIMPNEPGYIPVREAIRRALIQRRTNPNAVADAAGLNKFQVYRYLTVESAALDAQKISKLSKALKLPANANDGKAPSAPLAAMAGKSIAFPPSGRNSIGVPSSGALALIGVIESGAWRDPMSAEPTGISPCPNWSAEGQRVFQIGAAGIPKLASPGDHLIVLTNDPPIVEGCFVVMKRERDGLVEYSLYQAHTSRDKIELHPSSPRGNVAPRILERGKREGVIGVVIEVVKRRQTEAHSNSNAVAYA